MGTKEVVKLLGAPMSPFVMRPRIAMNLKGVKYEFLQEEFGNKSELLLKSNPVYKKIPVLIHNDRPVCESMLIVQYIDDAWPAAAGAGAAAGRTANILPSEPYDCAIARFWAYYIDDKWFPALSGIMRAQTEEARAEAVSQVPAGLQLLEEAFEKCSKGKSFFGGDSIGYLDIAFGCYLGWLKAMEKMSGNKFLDAGKVPHLVGWAERFCADAAVKEVMPETDTLVDFAKMIQAKMRGAPPAK